MWVLCPLWGARSGNTVVKPTCQPSRGRQLQPDHLHLPHAVWRCVVRNNDLVHWSCVPWWVVQKLCSLGIFPFSGQIAHEQYELFDKQYILLQVSMGSLGPGIFPSLGHIGVEKKRTRTSPPLCQRRVTLMVHIIIIIIIIFRYTTHLHFKLLKVWMAYQDKLCCFFVSDLQLSALRKSQAT